MRHSPPLDGVMEALQVVPVSDCHAVNVLHAFLHTIVKSS